MIFPAGYIHPDFGGLFNPYYGGFGHWNHPLAGGIGYTWPGFTWPFNFQTPALYATKAGFLG